MKNKNMIVVLLDLCAFALSQSKKGEQDEAIESFETARQIAEENEVSEVQCYIDFIERVF